MWIVRLALSRPYTFVVMAMLIVIGGVFTITRMAVDIFPSINIPVVAIVWNYGGIAPDEMEQRITGNFERALVSLVNDIEHTESQSLNGESVVKVFLQPGASVDSAVAQITAGAQTVLRQMPPGIFSPLIMRYSATNVPIVLESLGSDTLSEQQLFDLATNGLRPAMATVKGAQIPYPYGGKQRQIVVDIDPDKLFALKLSAADVTNELNAQNLILPAGTAKIGNQELNVRLNSSPLSVAEINDLPIKNVEGRTIYLRDVAHVRDGFIPQINIVHVDGKRGVVQPVLNGGASTLAIVDGIKEKLPGVLAGLPKSLKVSLLSDQSIFVRASIQGVLKEAAIAAGLTGLMILLFLGSWRSTLIVVISIPLSILISIIVLSLLGQTLNVMTLGGMALAVGILVDDATVEIENIHRNIGMRKGLTEAILSGAQQIAVPAFVSTLCICIVFVPVVFITGAAKSLFVPLGMAVVFAMLASYFLSRTLVPTMIQHLLAKEVDLYQHSPHAEATPTAQHEGIVQEEYRASPRTKWRGPIWWVHERFNRAFEAFRRAYGGWLAWALDHRAIVACIMGAFVVISCGLAPLIGRDFFPNVDSGQIRFHVRAPAGTRVEETERYFAKVQAIVHDIIPASEIKTSIDIIGVPNSGINLALSDGSMISSADGEVLVTLNQEHAPSESYIKKLRAELAQRMPELTVFFQPPDIVTQVLNFGIAAPIDVQVSGPRKNLEDNLRLAEELRKRIAAIPGAVDVHIQQIPSTPDIRVDVDRTLAGDVGLTQRDAANSILESLSSSGQVAPNYWLDPRSGVQYTMAVQTPQYKINSVEALKNTAISLDAKRDPQLLANLAKVTHGREATNIAHYNIANTYDILAGVQDQDLGSVSQAIDRIIAGKDGGSKLSVPPGTSITVRGQVESMNTSFAGLAFGLVFAVLLVYFLMVVNFQSWLDPFIILMALPGALAGILWMLFVTGTNISVPSLMGAIMSIGVATANSILMVTFANDQRAEGQSAMDAAWIAGVTRLRPVVMTALAMIIGMLPMSLGLGEGGEQNAPLGRAVIGGLSVATFATLFFVPVMYSILRKKAPRPKTHLGEAVPVAGETLVAGHAAG